MGDGQRAGSGEQTVSGAPWAVGGRLAGWPLTPASLRRVPTASRPAMSPSPCSRHSMAFGRCPRLAPRPSPRLPSMRRSPTRASRTACHRPAAHLPGSIGGWKAACRRANPGASPPTGEPGAGSPLQQACGPASFTSPPRPAPTSRPGPLSKHRVVIADGGHVPRVQPQVSHGSSRPPLEMLVTSPAGRSFSQTLAGFLEKYEGGTGSVELPRPQRLLHVTEWLQG